MINILDIPLFSGTLDEAVLGVLHICCEGGPKLNRCISATGAHGLVYATENKDFREVLRSFYLNLPDGMPCVWVGRIKGAKDMERCYGPDFFKNVMICTADKNIKHYLCGGKEGVAHELKDVIENRFGNSRIVGLYCPPFREMTEGEMKALVYDIQSKNTDIVWIGLSTPKQEFFAKKLSSFLKVHCIISVGAAFDFHTGKVRQAPKFIQRLGLEWFFRLLMEPRRLYKRYFKVVPTFFFYAIMDIIKNNGQHIKEHNV